MTPKQIRMIRTWFEWNQKDLAERLGVAENTIARWESGSRKPRGPAVVLLTQLWEQMKGESAAA